EDVRPLLAENTVRIVACHKGRVVGEEQEVRVFDIEYIKGLEFEAVFIVGLDGLATRVPDLFNRYLYVGVTRAATFLGVTCNQQLPGTLEFVRSFLTSSWA
ncbi:MAG TPA: ATP-binding domain-containing protein, partial [Terriglobales bacterium]|nr:ATP-binding domain-containing protein [Terriglobales bacterium]